ncbi:hypothetical protein TSA1_13660 [Bradyrhizobium nitroreducens]|uniref:Uncharacterized protein n=1 Tax=Bradyrhizobium nitroreducens TaxID=709803 RepID=A0A2M6UAU7_9BRAD|nr:hypothetical protein [Bradyrhizobium nitroreducens]PIT01699.1 hypothetical protein TSA1_13660 [Bradyrhizobium nitroreducens]
MLNAVTRPTALAVLLTAILASSSAISPLLAQSGSAGGSIGNDEKSLSGSRSDRSAEPAPSARRSKPAAEEPRSSRRSGGGGGGSFDGAWMVTSVGCGGSTSGAVVVSSGKVIGQGVSGTVSASGAVSTFGHGDGGVTFTGSGRLGARSGSGTWRRSDGCGGTWTSAKQ